MRSIAALFSLLISVPAFASYDASWYNAPIWSGEWPRGFVVTQVGFKVLARTASGQRMVPTVVCGLPYRAVFHPGTMARINHQVGLDGIKNSKAHCKGKPANTTSKSSAIKRDHKSVF